jgi:hypothetical protein
LRILFPILSKFTDVKPFRYFKIELGESENLLTEESHGYLRNEHHFLPCIALAISATTVNLFVWEDQVPKPEDKTTV